MAVSQAVALMAAGGAMSGLGEDTARSLVQRVRERIRSVFGGDERSVEALEGVIASPEDEQRMEELVSALAYYARKDEGFAGDLDEFARQSGSAVTQHIEAGRDAYVAGRDMTVEQRPTD